jgi:hypothetical protein
MPTKKCRGALQCIVAMIVAADTAEYSNSSRTADPSSSRATDTSSRFSEQLCITTAPYPIAAFYMKYIS